MTTPVPAGRRILLIEDEPGLVLTLTDRLASEGYETAASTDGPSGLRRASSEPWDLILLDVMLPGMSGFDVVKEIRQQKITAPVIMLTARGRWSTKCSASSSRRRLSDKTVRDARTARACRSATARGGSNTPAPRATSSATSMDVRKAEVRRNGQLIDMSAREFLLLKYFIEHREATLTRDELLNDVWGYHSMPSTRTVDVHVAWLRQKIEPNVKQPQYILTVHGMGYKFVG
jgi:two-component system alkaline phosphatase synthesis response regulator PhoP